MPRVFGGLMKKAWLTFILVVVCWANRPAHADILIPMDLTQTDHLKAYGVVFTALKEGVQIEWLLNYRSGSFLLGDLDSIVRLLNLRGVKYEKVGGSDIAKIKQIIEESNMETVLLEKAPRVAVYTPPNSLPWDDAVTLALDYAEVPYDKIWNRDILEGKLDDYDWLHLHHEDFTGQFGKFYASYHTQKWYQDDVKMRQDEANTMGYRKVSQMLLDVAIRIREYMSRGGFMFSMCSGTDSFDIALAAEGTDICESIYDGDPANPQAQSKLNFNNTVAFENFTLERDPLVYEFSNIDTSTRSQMRGPEADYFTLFDFSAKYDPVPAMLTQCHVPVVNGFMGQTTGFFKEYIKKSVVILGEVEGSSEAKYIHGNYGKGTFTFYGGHDPEDYQHRVNDPVTRLSLHPNSPGYRLILNNILFPAAKKKNLKT